MNVGEVEFFLQQGGDNFIVSAQKAGHVANLKVLEKVQDALHGESYLCLRQNNLLCIGHSKEEIRESIERAGICPSDSHLSWDGTMSEFDTRRMEIRASHYAKAAFD
jgi:hypothetical protein